MPELTRETLPPAGPDYPLAAVPAAGEAPLFLRRPGAATGSKPRPRLLPEQPERGSGRAGDDS
jgi:hypothetical protein